MKGRTPRTRGGAASDAFVYDVFVSYAHSDNEWVHRELLPQLEAARLRVCVDSNDFTPGALSIVEMERAIVESRKTLAVLTPAYAQSSWTTFESALDCMKSTASAVLGAMHSLAPRPEARSPAPPARPFALGM